MSEEEILKYAKIFSTARGDTFKIHFNDKTINEPDVWKGVLVYIDKLQKVIDLMAELCIKLGCELSLVKEVKEFTDMCFGCKYKDEECNRNDCIERLIEYYTKKVEE